jgi:hypothetical protein
MFELLQYQSLASHGKVASTVRLADNEVVIASQKGQTGVTRTDHCPLTRGKAYTGTDKIE